MMNHDQQFRLAQNQLRHGQVDHAIETLARILGEEPDDADAHALLSLALLRRKRLAAATLESQKAIMLAPESTFAHVSAAAIETASRRFSRAEEHLLTALAIEPESSSARYQLASLYLLWGRGSEAENEVNRACSLDPDNVDLWVLAGDIALSRGNREDAERRAQEALEIDAEHVDALVLLGRIELAAGNSKQARVHTIWALQLDPNDEGALSLLGALKARSSFVLGLWWRFQSFVSSGSQRRTIVLLIGMYLLYRITTIFLASSALKDWVPFASAIWLAFCVYTWFAPTIFRRALKKEMAQVRLDSSF